MTRQIKFRGLVNDGTWSYGVPVKNPTHDTVTMVQRMTDDDIICSVVNSETVGQFIEKTDLNGDEIYDGDILKDEYNRILLVEWWKCGFGFRALCETNFIKASSIMEWFEGDVKKPVIIGNVHQNPELLEACK